MTRILTFLPVRRSEAIELARDGVAPACPRLGFSATPELVAALGYQPDQSEDAEYAAMVLASVWGLANFGERLVLVAELADDQVHPGDEEVENGGVQVLGVVKSAVVAWFADPDGVAQAAAQAAHGLGIDAAWETPEVQELLVSHDLMWHGVEELSQLVEGEG